jgi:hypothetical protein
VPVAVPVALEEALGATTPTWTLGMDDEPSGVRSVPALRRDLVLEQAWPSAKRTVVVSLAFLWTGATTGGSPAIDRPVVDRMLTAAASTIGSKLGPRDGIYRTGVGELAVLLRGMDEGRIGERMDALRRLVDSAIRLEGNESFLVRAVALAPGDVLHRSAEGATPAGLRAAV